LFGLQLFYFIFSVLDATKLQIPPEKIPKRTDAIKTVAVHCTKVFGNFDGFAAINSYLISQTGDSYVDCGGNNGNCINNDLQLAIAQVKPNCYPFGKYL